MEVKIIAGPNTDKNIQRVYDYLVQQYRKEQKIEGNIRKGFNGRASTKRL